MINACCNLYFCFIITVHGDIRHLESYRQKHLQSLRVHGDIRHLEMRPEHESLYQSVHGDIRHLENNKSFS